MVYICMWESMRVGLKLAELDETQTHTLPHPPSALRHSSDVTGPVACRWTAGSPVALGVWGSRRVGLSACGRHDF